MATHTYVAALMARTIGCGNPSSIEFMVATLALEWVEYGGVVAMLCSRGKVRCDLTMFCRGVAQGEKGILRTGLDDVWIK
ncbi:hypothetical protein [Xylella fastidiosa]|nr:hypothetical protein [Xylella fastidiosa]UIX81612.1 hypothetical protein LZ756_01625 [Xylella fastidiosa subsp. sandyi]